MQEILDEVVRELHKVKDEIINGKSCLFFPVFTLLCNITHYSFLFCSQPSDTKSAESVHPNLTGATAGGEREAGRGYRERRAGGMFSQCFCRLQRRCANIWVCWTAKLKKKKKKEEMNREYGTDEVCMTKGSRGGGKMDEEVEKDWKKG